jgi:hypothetical protein
VGFDGCDHGGDLLALIELDRALSRVYSDVGMMAGAAQRRLAFLTRAAFSFD